MSRKLFTLAVEDFDDTDLAINTREVGTPPAEPAPAPEPAPAAPTNEVADLSELNVVKLADASREEQDEQIREEHEKSLRTNHDALTDMQTLVVAYECLRDCIETKHRGALALSQQVHADYRKKHALGPMKKSVSLEAYEKPETAAVAMESIKDTVKSIISAVLNAIRKALMWMKTWFRTYFSQTHLVSAAVDKAHDVFSTFRKKNGETLTKYYKSINVDMASFVHGFQYKGILSYCGRQPGERYVGSNNFLSTDSFGTTNTTRTEIPDSYAGCFKDIAELVGVNLLLDKYIDKGFLRAFETVENSLSEGKYPTETMTFFSPRALLPKQSTECEHAEGINRAEGTSLYYKDGYLGNRVVITQLSDTQVGDRITNGMHEYSEWKMWLKSNASSVANGNMYYLSTEEAEAAYKQIKEIGKAAMSFRKTNDQIEYVLDGLLVVLQKLNAGLSDIDGEGPKGVDADAWAKVDQWELVRATISAASAINSITDTYLVPVSAYARDIMRAWYEYLKATLETENDYIVKAKAAKR